MSLVANFLWATLTFWLGGIGMFMTRFFRGNWTDGAWNYIPFFWLPVIGSWPISLQILFGGIPNVPG